ncbi:hypothetical protein MMC17_000700 [Xylographa soralifera]|nr:hypothetical protein [Xylographa soralifera]
MPPLSTNATNATNASGWTWSAERRDYYRAERQPNGESQDDRDRAVVPELMREGQLSYIFSNSRANHSEGSASSVPTRASPATSRPHQIVPSSGLNPSGTSAILRTLSSPSTASTGYSTSFSRGPSTAATDFTQNQLGKQPVIPNFGTLSVSDDMSVPSYATTFKGADGAYDWLDPCEHAIFITLGYAAAINPGKHFAESNRVSSGPSGSQVIRISTYGGQATLKKGLDQRKHTMVYSSHVPPAKLPQEKKLNKDPIRVNIVNEEEKLDVLSRINLAKTYPVEHNVKVKTVGTVKPEELKKLKAYWKECVNS